MHCARVNDCIQYWALAIARSHLTIRPGGRPGSQANYRSTEASSFRKAAARAHRYTTMHAHGKQHGRRAEQRWPSALRHGDGSATETGVAEVGKLAVTGLR